MSASITFSAFVGYGFLGCSCSHAFSGPVDSLAVWRRWIVLCGWKARPPKGYPVGRKPEEG